MNMLLLLFSVFDSLRPHGLQHARLPCPSLSPEFVQIHVHWVGDVIKNTGVGCHFLLQRISPTQGLNLYLLCLRYCRQIFYPLNHGGSLRSYMYIQIKYRRTCSYISSPWNFLNTKSIRKQAICWRNNIKRCLSNTSLTLSLSHKALSSIGIWLLGMLGKVACFDFIWSLIIPGTWFFFFSWTIEP